MKTVADSLIITGEAAPADYRMPGTGRILTPKRPYRAAIIPTVKEALASPLEQQIGHTLLAGQYHAHPGLVLPAGYRTQEERIYATELLADLHKAQKI